MYDQTGLNLGLDSISLKCLFQNENNVVLNENCVERKPYINRKSKSLEITIQLYSCYDENEAPSSCNTTVYLLFSIIVPGPNFCCFFMLTLVFSNSSSNCVEGLERFFLCSMIFHGGNSFPLALLSLLRYTVFLI